MPGLEPEVRNLAVQDVAAILDAMLREAREIFPGAKTAVPETDPPQVESSSRTSDSVPVESIPKMPHRRLIA